MGDDEVSWKEGGVRKPVDRYWAEVMGLRTAMGELRFRALTQVMVAVLSLPHSNADCERSFSVVRKVHTECRQSMATDTLTALLQCKMNVDTECFRLSVTDEMVALAKRATHEYNMAHE